MDEVDRGMRADSLQLTANSRREAAEESREQRKLKRFREESERGALELLCPKCGVPIVEGYPGHQQTIRFQRVDRA